MSNDAELAPTASEHPSHHKFDMEIFHPADRAHWRKFALWQVVSAARPDTRAARIAKIVQLAQRGESR